MAAAPALLSFSRSLTSPERAVHNAFLAVTAAFLFGYQMHEKTVLLPLVVASLAYPRHSTSVLCLNITCMLSMFDLMRRDGHATSYAIGLLLLIATALRTLPPRAWDRVGLAVAVSAVVLLHAAQELLPPPAKYPWLYPYLFALISCARQGARVPVSNSARLTLPQPVAVRFVGVLEYSFLRF